MSGWGRILLATVCGLVLAAMVHIVAVLSVPWLSEQDAFSRLRGTLAADRAQLIAAPGKETWLPRPDPGASVAACAYNLNEGPLRISARTGPIFESLSFHARGGPYYAVTDRAAIRGALDLVVMTRSQLEEAQASDDGAEPSRDVRIVAPQREGLAIIRAVAPFPSQRDEAAAAAQSVLCVTQPLTRRR